MKKASSSQMSLDFTDIDIVKNSNGEKWHIQRSNGFDLDGIPVFFDSSEAAAEYARNNGIKIRTIFNEWNMPYERS